MPSSGSRCHNVLGGSCRSTLYKDLFEEQRLRYQTSIDNVTADIEDTSGRQHTRRTRQHIRHVDGAYFNRFRSTILQTPRLLSLFSKWTSSDDQRTHIFRKKYNYFMVMFTYNIIVILTSGHVILNSFVHLLCVLFFHSLCHFLSMRIWL